MEAYKEKLITPGFIYKKLLRIIRLKNIYGKRSLVETFFSRFKAYFTDKLSNRKRQHIINEINYKIQILNKINA